MAVQRNKSLLIVDDAKVNIDFLVGALGEKYRIAVALNGENALKLALRNRPDLILLDVIMPGMDGFEVCRQLREKPETEGIPVLFATALDDEESRRRVAESGAQGSIAKPFDREELLSAVEARLRSAG
jgi:sigma-B regulation protein RsbU (phosphoserine phosphatase)